MPTSTKKGSVNAMTAGPAFLFCFCCISWIGREKTNYFRIAKQTRKHQQKPISPECMELSKIFTLKPNRLTEDDFIKLFKKVQNCGWMKNSTEHRKIRSQLQKCCNASKNFVITQLNTPLGTNVSYAVGSKNKITITKDIFDLIPKTDPFKDHKLKYCSVVGNAGFLINSSCGAEINEADFVFRCNIPPIKDYKDDVGTKTDMVTLNPSILRSRFRSLNSRRKPFMDHVSIYENALILLPAFTYSSDASISFKVSFTLQDFGAKQQAIFLGPSYQKSLTQFWKAQGIGETSLSSGLILLSAALEMCEEVWVYGFWPFSKDVAGNQLFHHYYDNKMPKKVHSFSNEFYKLLLLHMKGVVKVQAGQCGKSSV
ncbi:alpha-2,8-sialyltransferase 8F-like isoform X3 [Hypanus sabinus]|uniref:alpha-2,8-sialyltransferase 8F-like isoform X3 n=1 Tax=Hypanus sabinus TaxID=79690 RepID=UPI0028C3D19C|nr:alpha-2,8-sialyltransferase 8F-like isoform X3 [Hypanus sabinus]XP_059828150.1 alpha-2,8-sialyltransferase 8F-like isoform X3 [Hypanus sabinus]